MKDNKKPIPDKSRRAPKRDIDGVFLLDKPSGTDLRQLIFLESK